jgi:glycosyltransferase involved in cell wall biosynthesis
VNGHEPAAPEFKLICHGTITFRLGLDIALRAVDLARKTVPSVRLLVLGEGDFLATSRAVVKTLGLEPCVNFIPSIPVEQLPAVLAQAAIGIVPNRMTSATQLMLPSKLLEYATMGIPVIASRLRTIECYFPDDAVRYIEPGNVAGLAAAIEELYHQPEKRHALALKAAAVIANLDWGHQRDQLFNAVDLLLGRRKGPCAVVHTSQQLQAGG